MQLRLKGFVGIESLVSNTKGVISAVGELSTLSLTYSKDVGLYNSTAPSGYNYYSFLCAFDNGVAATVPLSIEQDIFQLAAWVYNKQILNGAPSTRFDFLNDLVEQFQSTSTAINCGEMIQVDSNFFFPEWITWKKNDLPEGDPAQDNAITVWFADASFSSQYDEYAITVVAPVDNLELFFNSKAALLAALNSRPLSETMLKIQEAKGGYPESILSGESFDWVDPVTSSRHSTNWTLLIYGGNGDDVDAIRQAIRDFLSAHSTRTEAEWRAVFPDIYKNTEFLIYPRWANYAIADMQLFQGIHSPISNLRKEINYLKQVQPGLSAEHIESHATALPCNYKSLNLLFIAGPDNRDSIYDIKMVYPDLLNVPTNDTLWTMMSSDTRAWVTGIQEMLMIAETVGTYTDMPTGLRKVARAGVIYVTKKFGNINFLVASKATTPAYV
jgi:hypothetical protein